MRYQTVDNDFKKKTPSLRIVKNLIFEKKNISYAIAPNQRYSNITYRYATCIIPAPFQNHLEINHNACKENQESFLGVICIQVLKHKHHDKLIFTKRSRFR